MAIYEIQKKLSGGREEIRIQYEPDVELDEFESKLRNSQDRAVQQIVLPVTVQFRQYIIK